MRRSSARTLDRSIAGCRSALPRPHRSRCRVRRTISSGFSIRRNPTQPVATQARQWRRFAIFSSAENARSLPAVPAFIFARCLEASISRRSMTRRCASGWRAKRGFTRTEFLHEWLEKRDAARARALHPGDSYRVLRALEIALAQSPARSSEERARTLRGEGLSWLLIFLDVPQAEIDRRIAARTERHVGRGIAGRGRTHR